MKNKYLDGSLYLSLATFIFLISGYLINILLGRILGPAEYGIYGLIISLVTYINVIQTTGFTQTVSKFISEGKEDPDSILKSGMYLQLLTNSLFFILFFFFSDLIALLLKDQSLSPYIKFSSFIFPIFGFYGLYHDYYNGLHRFRKQAFMNILYSICKTLFVLSLAFTMQIKGVIIGFMIAPVIPLVFGIHFPKSTVRKFPLIKLFLFAIPIVALAIFSNLLQSIDLFYVKALSDVKENPGYYAASQNISRIIFFSMSALFLVIFPAISKSTSNQLHASTRIIIQKTLRLVLISIIPAAFIMSATSRELIEIIYSSPYLPASSSLSILLFGMVSFTIFTALSYILSGAGKPLIPAFIAIIGLLITSIACMILIPKYSLNGAAISTFIGSSISMFLACLYVYYSFKILISIISVVKILLTSIMIYFIASVIHLPIYMLPMIYILLGGLYLATLYYIKELTPADITEFKRILPSWVLKNRLINIPNNDNL